MKDATDRTLPEGEQPNGRLFILVRGHLLFAADKWGFLDGNTPVGDWSDIVTVQTIP
ncbi:MAG: hypothetical protein ACKVQW_15700 [Pyrinomonadaceae bacterium]